MINTVSVPAAQTPNQSVGGQELAPPPVVGGIGAGYGNGFSRFVSDSKDRADKKGSGRVDNTGCDRLAPNLSPSSG